MDIKRIKEVDFKRIKFELINIVRGNIDPNISETIKLATVMYLMKVNRVNSFEELISCNTIEKKLLIF